jgi:hypothetical protein
MDLFLREAADRIGAEDALTKVDALMTRRAFGSILQRGLKRSGAGPQGYDPLVLFKCLLIGQWHGLSDPKLERALKVRRGLAPTSRPHKTGQSQTLPTIPRSITVLIQMPIG